MQHIYEGAEITRHSIDRAADEAVKLWALVSAQYPYKHRLIVEVAGANIVEVVSAFALNARRGVEALPKGRTFRLKQPYWQWEPTVAGDVVQDLWDALNRIIHARQLYVGWEQLPKECSAVAGGAVVAPYIRAETDRKALAFIDPFAMSHCFLYEVLPILAPVVWKETTSQN